MNDIEKALLTWYPKDDPLHNDPLHPAIKLAGEAGELLDLYGKERFKPGFDWWLCKHCKQPEDNHTFTKISGPLWCDDGNMAMVFTPLVLDEIGDIWYYIRILAYQANIKLDRSDSRDHSLPKCLAYLNCSAASVYLGVIEENKIFPEMLLYTYYNLLILLQKLDISLEQVTELNYRKLNSEPTAHGWRKKS